MVVAAIKDVKDVAQAQQRHAQTNAGHSSTRGLRKQYTLSQARGICQHKQAGKHANEGKVHACRCRERANRKDMQCKYPARRNATHKNGGGWPEGVQFGHQGEARGRRLGVVFELARRTTGFWASGCRTCRLVPSSIDYASQKWSREARTDAPERAAACPSTRPCGTAIRFRTCIGKPCQRPGPLLAPSLPASHPQHTIVISFWFLVCYAATQLANQLQQTPIQVVRSNRIARKRLNESNGIPAMDLGHMNDILKYYYFYVLFYYWCFEVDIRTRIYTNKRFIEKNTHEQ